MSKKITAKAPSAAFIESYLEPTLVQAKAYHIARPDVQIKLDQNESPYDWPSELKEVVTRKLLEVPWNRYPSDYADDLADKLADYAGVATGSILLAPGSNYLCALTIDLFSQRLRGKVVVARPSFALYETHCRYTGIAYEPWLLTEDLEYDPSALKDLPKGSLVVFASPNNPVGNSLARDDFAKLLATHRDSLFIADEAYYEFSSEPYTELLSDFDNLILIRTFSKSLGSAGVRIGYAIAAKPYIEQMRKLRLPYLLNQFSLVAGHTILSHDGTRALIQRNVDALVEERERVHRALAPLCAEAGVGLKNSRANFLLLRWPTSEAAAAASNALVERDIIARDVSKGPGLAGCLRVTIGQREENDRFVAAFASTLNMQKL